MLSKTIASLLPIPSLVALPNFFAPTLSKVKLTTVSLLILSICGLASTKLSPLIITLLLTFNSSVSSKVINLSVPKEASLLLVTNLKSKFAVLPKRFFILSGLSKPGSSTKILFEPFFAIVGSLVPTSSILFLTISTA